MCKYIVLTATVSSFHFEQKQQQRQQQILGELMPCYKVLSQPVNFSFLGGSPYPRMDGRKIVSLLQDGYRMPKPQHVDDEL